MLVTRTRPHRATSVVDLAPVLGVGDGARLPAREIDVGRGMAGAQKLARLGAPSVVMEGVILRTVTLGVRTSAALYGVGDILPAAQAEPVPFTAATRALTPARLVAIDDRVTAAIAADPALADALAARVSRHNDLLALLSVLTQLVSIEERLHVLLPHLAERWGTVTSDGVVLPAFLSHTVLAALVGVRRPSLTTAIASLAENGLFNRLPDRRWLVAPELAGLATA